MKKRLSVLVAVVLILALSLGACGGGSSAKATAEGFLNAMKNFDGDKLAEFVVDEAKEEAKLGIESMASLKSTGIKMEFKDIKVEESGDTAKVTYTMTMSVLGQTTEQPSTLDLVKVGGKWKVGSFE